MELKVHLIDPLKILFAFLDVLEIGGSGCFVVALFSAEHICLASRDMH